MQKTDILNEGDSFTMAVGGKGFTIKEFLVRYMSKLELVSWELSEEVRGCVCDVRCGVSRLGGSQGEVRIGKQFEVAFF